VCENGSAGVIFFVNKVKAFKENKIWKYQKQVWGYERVEACKYYLIKTHFVNTSLKTFIHACSSQ